MSVNILSHNVCWFQGHPYLDPDPGEPNPVVWERLLALYRRHDPDVLCLQEIQSEAVFEALKDALGLGGVYTPGGEHPQYGGAMLWRRGSLSTQSSDVQPRPQRVWQRAQVLDGSASGYFANLHLASARQLGEEAASQTRLSDITQLLSGVPRPKVIAGDFNEGPTGAVSALLNDEGYVDTATVLGISADSTGVDKPRSDQIWVHESAKDSVEAGGVGSWEELAFDQGGKSLLTDHLPLWIHLK